MADERSDRQSDEQIRRENEGYDEAARGGPNMPPSDVGIRNPGDRRMRDEFDRAADDAAMEVRRREHSADAES